MDYWTGQLGSPIYEFPYSGDKTPSLPFFNSNVLGSNNNSSFDNLLYNQPSTFTSYGTSQIPSTLNNNNVTVYQVPGDIPLETILRQLGVDVNSLRKTSSFDNNYRGQTPSPYKQDFIPRSPTRRRRLVCDEVSDDESDEYRRYSSRYGRDTEYRQSPINRPNSLGNAWSNAQGPPGNLPRSNTAPNMNAQWQGMQNTSPSSPQQRAATNVWNRALNTANKTTNRLTNIFNKPEPGSGTVIQPPYPGVPQNQEAVRNFNAVRNLPPGVNQPTPSLANVWNRAVNAPQYGPPSPPSPMNSPMTNPWNRPTNVPQYGPPSPPPPMNSPLANVWNRATNANRSGPPGVSNLPWNRMASASSSPPMNSPLTNVWNRAVNAPQYGPPSPPPMNSPAVNVWNRAANAPQYGPPSSPFNNAWNRMSSPPPPSSPMNPAWNQMSRGSPPPPQQSYYPPGPAVNSMWNQMR